MIVSDMNEIKKPCFIFIALLFLELEVSALCLVGSLNVSDVGSLHVKMLHAAMGNLTKMTNLFLQLAMTI